MTMIPQYGVAVGSALTTVVHAEDAQPNEIIQGQKRKRTLPPKIMVSKPQPRYTNVPSGRQAIKSGLQYAIRSRPWRGGRGGYANQGGRQGQDTTRDRTNDHPYGGGRHPQSDDAMDRRIKIVSVSDGTTRNAKPYKRTRPDSESSGSTSASTTTPSAQASTTHVQPALVSTSSTSTNVRLPKRRKVNRPGIHDVGEEIIIGPRSPEASTAPSARRVIDAQPPPAPAAIDLTFLDEPGLYVMTKSPQSPHHDGGLTSPLYIPFIPATVDLRPSSPLLLSLSTLPSREVDHSQPSKKTRPEVTREHQTQKGRDRAQNSNKEARPRSPSPFLLPSLRRKTSQELYADNVHSLSPTLKPALPTRQNITTRTGTITPPSPSPKLATPFLPPLNLPPSLPLHSTTIMGDSAGVADSTPIKRIASGIVKEETLISPSVATPSAGPSRRLITSGCEFYPMPESCSKTHPDFKENRKTFAKEKWRHLQSFGFKRKKCTGGWVGY
ncbi:hypothetical protein BJ165DRAFT_425671 [Panaeolus papilionaceus]|nr:hypothetical protein BJ165DRAFT_425671 [Panaeolus papilionaceus]